MRARVRNAALITFPDFFFEEEMKQRNQNGLTVINNLSTEKKTKNSTHCRKVKREINHTQKNAAMNKKQSSSPFNDFLHILQRKNENPSLKHLCAQRHPTRHGEDT